MKRFALLVFVLFMFFGAQAAEKMPADPMIGPWVGSWASGRADGSMEVTVSTVAETTVKGQVRATNPEHLKCSEEWHEVTGAKARDGKVTVNYDLGGRCGRVEFVFWLEQSTMKAAWKNDRGSSGTATLQKAASPVGATGSVSVSNIEPK